MKEYTEFKQQSEEWYAIRDLKMSGSHATAIGNKGDGLNTYARKLVMEHKRVSGGGGFSNEQTERGNELEPEARTIYELETGNSVREVAFIEYNDYAGCSPDGLVDKDVVKNEGKGGIEIKCVDDYKFFSYLLDGLTVESGHDWQIQFCMLVSERDWWDYVVYNQNFEKCILIKRVYRNEEKIQKLKEGLVAGEELIKKNLELYNKA